MRLFYLLLTMALLLSICIYKNTELQILEKPRSQFERSIERP